jgi:hypothetical protein
MAALAQTSLDIDILTIATLNNRGSVLSSSQAYVPIVSSFTIVESISKVAFSVWTNEPVNRIYDSVFYNYSNGDPFVNSISTIQTLANQVSSSIYLINIPISTFTSTNYAQLVTLSNTGPSTISSFQNIYEYDSTIVDSNYFSINLYYSSIVPGVSTTVNPASTFYDTLFAPTASSIIEQGIFYYIPRETIDLYTYDALTNPYPLLGGDFGSNIPLPFYWTGVPSRFIGPGISSISTIFQDPNNYPFFQNISSGFEYVLSSVSTGWAYSNASLDVYRQDIVNTVLNAAISVDGGSTISTLYYDINSTFVSTLDYASTFGPNVSTLSTFAVTEIEKATIPTFRGFSIAQYISTGNITLNNNQQSLNIRLNSSMSSVQTLINPYTVFSTIVNSTISTGLKRLADLDCFPGLYLISTIAKNSFDPFFTSTTVSTNYLGYLGLSSYTASIFSTFSTAFPYILGKELFSSLSTLNRNISTLSTLITLDASTIYGVPIKYITGPGISSMYSDFSTNITVSYNDYTNIISTTNKILSSAIINVNSGPGMSTLSTTAYRYTSTIKGQISTITAYISSGFNTEYLAIQSTNSSIISQVNLNIFNFISAGISSYRVSLSTFGYVSSVVNAKFAYVSSQVSRPNGAIYKSISSYDSLASTTLYDLVQFAGSSIYYPMLPIITDYSTSLYAKGDLIPTYIERSTTFFAIEVKSSINCPISSFNIEKAGIEVDSTGDYNFAVEGAISIQPPMIKFDKNGNPLPLLPLPTIGLNNLQIYSYVNPTSFIPSTAIVSYTSTISFNSSNLTVKRNYNNNAFGYLGINTLTPTYSLDIAIGDARKPTGTTWVTASDSRVKDHISTVDFQAAIEKISSLRLVSYTWSESYRVSKGLSINRTIGFLSQEVEPIFPDAVTMLPENGLDDFRSLDMDQIYKAKFAVTQNLIGRASTLQMRLNRLMKES